MSSSSTLTTALLGVLTTATLAACTPTNENAPPTTVTTPTPEVQATVEPTRLTCTFPGEPGERYARDCDAEIDRYQERTDQLLGELELLQASSHARLGAVRSGVATLVERRRQICADWNACAFSRDDHLALYDWLGDELAALEAHAHAVQAAPMDSNATAALQAWASGLTSRRPGATPPQPPAPARPPTAAQATPTGPPPMAAEARTRMAVTMGAQEREILELRQLLDMVRQVRSASEGATPGSAPVLCRDVDSTRPQLEEMVRGANSSVSSSAEQIADRVADVCDRYGRQATPDDRVRSALDRLFAHFDRVDGWMDDILRCTLPGADRRRCSNAYGGRQPNDIAEARRVKSIVASFRQRFHGARDGRPPFPCDFELPVELERAAWTLSVARAQMPSVARNIENVCSTIGLDEAALEQSTTLLGTTLDRVESNLGMQIASRQDVIERLRPYLENEPAPAP